VSHLELRLERVLGFVFYDTRLLEIKLPELAAAGVAKFGLVLPQLLDSLAKNNRENEKE
jgi:hypothetical protein